MNKHFYTLFLVIALVIIGTIVGNMSKRGNNQATIEAYILPEDALASITERDISLILDTKKPNANPLLREAIDVFKAQGVLRAANVSYTLNDAAFMDVRVYSMEDASRAAAFHQQSQDALAAEGVDYREDFGIGAQALYATIEYGTIIRFYDEDIVVTMNALSDDEDGMIAFARAYREWVQAQLAK